MGIEKITKETLPENLKKLEEYSESYTRAAKNFKGIWDSLDRKSKKNLKREELDKFIYENIFSSINLIYGVNLFSEKSKKDKEELISFLNRNIQEKDLLERIFSRLEDSQPFKEEFERKFGVSAEVLKSYLDLTKENIRFLYESSKEIKGANKENDKEQLKEFILLQMISTEKELAETFEKKGFLKGIIDKYKKWGKTSKILFGLATYGLGLFAGSWLSSGGLPPEIVGLVAKKVGLRAGVVTGLGGVYSLLDKIGIKKDKVATILGLGAVGGSLISGFWLPAVTIGGLTLTKLGLSFFYEKKKRKLTHLSRETETLPEKSSNKEQIDSLILRMEEKIKEELGGLTKIERIKTFVEMFSSFLVGGAIGYNLSEVATEIKAPPKAEDTSKATIDTAKASPGDTTKPTMPQTHGVEKVEQVPEKIEIVAAGKGDSVWKVIEKTLEKNFPAFKELNKEQKTYVIDYLKDEVLKDPSKYGIKGIETVKAGNIEWVIAKISEKWGSGEEKTPLIELFKSKTLDAINKAKGLTDEQIKSIRASNEAYEKSYPELLKAIKEKPPAKGGIHQPPKAYEEEFLTKAHFKAAVENVTKQTPPKEGAPGKEEVGVTKEKLSLLPYNIELVPLKGMTPRDLSLFNINNIEYLTPQAVILELPRLWEEVMHFMKNGYYKDLYTAKQAVAEFREKIELVKNEAMNSQWYIQEDAFKLVKEDMESILGKSVDENNVHTILNIYLEKVRSMMEEFFYSKVFEPTLLKGVKDILGEKVSSLVLHKDYRGEYLFDKVKLGEIEKFFKVDTSSIEKAQNFEELAKLTKEDPSKILPPSVKDIVSQPQHFETFKSLLLTLKSKFASELPKSKDNSVLEFLMKKIRLEQKS